MSAWRYELIGSLDLQPTVDKIRSNMDLDFAEYSLLREAVEAKFYHLRGKVRGNGARELSAALQSEQQLRKLQDASIQGEEDLRRLQDACLRVAQLIQTSCLALRQLQLDHRDLRLLREAMESQMAFMHACMHRSLANIELHG
ncbi:hypothetical protein [Pseudomonas putida]